MLNIEKEFYTSQGRFIRVSCTIIVGEESVKRTYIFVKGVLHITRQVHSSLYKRVSCPIVCGSAKNV